MTPRILQSKLPISASVIIPIYNNEKTVASELGSCEKILSSVVKTYEIVACDDKSTDRTAEILKRFSKRRKNLRVVFHKRNLGVSKTLRELYFKSKYSYVVPYSVDGDWNAKDIGRLLRRAHSEKADITIGKRPKRSYSRYRQIISFFYNSLPILLFGVNTIDAGSIKVIKREILQNIPLKSKSVFFEAEIIIRAKKKGANIVSLPINYKRKRDSSNAGGKTNLVLQAIKDMLRLRLDF